MNKISDYMDVDIILLDDMCDDRYDLYGDFICVQNPPGFDFIEGKSYHTNGFGSLTMNASWDMDIDLEEHTHGYNLKSHIWDQVTGEAYDQEILIPTEIFIRYFVHQFRFQNLEEQTDYIDTIMRERKINELLND